MRTNAVKFVRIYIVLSLIVAFGATACDRKNLTLAEAGAVTFHARFNSGQRLDIYADADEDFQKAGTGDSFVQFLDAKYRQLGEFRTTSILSYSINWTLNGRLVSISYRSTFAKGSAQEDFVWSVSGEMVRLRKYWLS